VAQKARFFSFIKFSSPAPLRPRNQWRNLISTLWSVLPPSAK
jgi:hypothetical protein